MARPLEFKVYDTESKMWSAIISGSIHKEMQDQWLYALNTVDKKKPIVQFTGKYDSNGTKIFEYDLIEQNFVIPGEGDVKAVGVIEWCGDCAAFYARLQKGAPDGYSIGENCKVVGSFLVNPELFI